MNDNFRSTLEALMQQNDISAVRLATDSRLSESAISRIRSGEKTVEPGEIVSLARAVSPDLKQQAQLIASHLMDERGQGPASELIQIKIGDTPAAPLLKEEYKTDLEIIREHLQEEDVQKIISGLANLLKNGNPKPRGPVTYAPRKNKK